MVKYLEVANYEKSNGIGQTTAGVNKQFGRVWVPWKTNDKARDRQQIAVGVSETGAYTSRTEEYWQWSGAQIAYRSHAINRGLCVAYCGSNYIVSTAWEKWRSKSKARMMAFFKAQE